MNKRAFGALALICGIILGGMTAPVQAQAQAAYLSTDGGDTVDAVAVDAVRKTGPVTHLPMPRFVSMKAREGNVRRGPSLTHRIDWVYKRQDMPLQIVAEHGHWRRVRDQDGMGGWVHYSLLSGARTVLVQAEAKDLRMRADDRAPVVARLEEGVVARLGDCGPEWCKLRVGAHRGWTRKDGLWGVGADEIRD